MKLISHRGNINGPDPSRENTIEYVEAAISTGVDVEIDIWYTYGAFSLGHDYPASNVELEWIMEHASSLWLHCKNIPAFEILLSHCSLNCFMHDKDIATLTSNKTIWSTYPSNGIIVIPESTGMKVTDTQLGVCTDYILKYLQ